MLKVLFFGPPGAGKTTLLSVLLNLDIKVLRESTGVLDRKLVQFKIAVQKQTEKSISHWKMIEINEEIGRLRGTIEKIIEARTACELQENSDLHISDLEPDMKIDEKLQSVVDSMTSENQNQHFITSSTLIACYDSGGQPEFFDVMPAFITATTGNIMIFDMSKNLNSKLSPEFFKEGQRLGSSDVKTHYTGTQLLKTALANIQSYTIQYSSHSTAKSSSQKSKLLVVGTHLDSCGDTEDEKYNRICAIEKIIWDDVLEDCSAISLIKRRKGANTIIHPIANNCNQDSNEAVKVREETAQEIRTAIESMSENKHVSKEVPISWLLFQYEIKLISDHCISRSDCNGIAEKSYIDANDVDDVLSFFHELGILLYYKGNEKLEHVVFSDPQWLFTQLNKLIEIKYRTPVEARKSIKNGIFKKEFLTEIYGKEFDTENVLQCEDMLNLFVHLNIMARLSDVTEQYFMPALLDPAPDNILIDARFGKQAFSTLLIKFKDGFFPRGVFCCLIALCINKIRSWKLQYNETYKDLIVFQIENNDEYLILSDKINYISLQIYCKEDLAQNKHQLICCTLYENLKILCDRIHLSGEFKFGFLCEKDKKFANIQEQHPCYPENLLCSDCQHSPRMTYDQLVWFISPKLMDIFKKVSIVIKYFIM